jgi:hypothetical protein
MFLRNVGIYQQVHTALQPTTATSTSSVKETPHVDEIIGIISVDLNTLDQLLIR